MTTDGYGEGAPDVRPLRMRFRRTPESGRAGRLDFFDLNDGLALIGPAIQTGVMGKLEFVALRTDRHPRRGDPQFLCPALVASGS